MNEQQLRRLFRRLVSLSAPLPLAALGGACGGSTTDGADTTMLAGGSSATAGGGGTAEGGRPEGGTPSGGTRASTAGTTSTSGGASVGTGGAGGTGGTSAMGGNGTGAITGTGGGAIVCEGSVPGSCTPIVTKVPRGCLTAEEAVVGHQLLRETCHEVCNPSTVGCSVQSVDAGSVSVLCNPGCAVGRRPVGLLNPPPCTDVAAGSYFAEVAHLEAASVTAFRILRDELRTKGAPKKLVRAAGRAARDEIRHARSTNALARRFGGKARRPVVLANTPRSVEAMAIENAVEGCVRETFGALLATRQALQARDPVVRATMQRIARDETEHAALAWRVARFLDRKLTPEARRRVASAKRAAADDLVMSLANEPPVIFAQLAGLPSPMEAAELAGALKRELWF